MPEPSLIISNSPPRRLLVRGVNWLGDAVMTTPALQRLRERFPEAEITILTHGKIADMYRSQPFVDHVLTFATGEGVWTVARRLASRAFDTALILPNSPRSALEAWLAHISRRIGYSRPWRTWLLTHSVAPQFTGITTRKRSVREIRRLARLPMPNPEQQCPVPTEAHHLHQYLRLVAALGADPNPIAPRLEMPPAELEDLKSRWQARIQDQFKLDPSAPGLWFGLNPSAAYGPAKRWPVENFAEVVRLVSAKRPAVWLAFGPASDTTVCDEIARRSGGTVLNLAGRTSVRELMGLLKLCRFLLTNDSGPLHLAAALGTPVVALFGSTSPELTGPGLPGDPRHHILHRLAPCSPCFRRTCPIDFRCMTAITANEVWGRISTFDFP